MRRLFLLFGVCLVVVLMIAPVAGAQTSGGQAAIAVGAPPSPEFVLYSDGNITIGGDVGTDCYSFVTYDYPQTVQPRLQEGAQAVADTCRQLGLPRGDFDFSDADVVLSIPANPPPEAYTGTEVLPDTGGIPLAFVAALAGSLALISFGGLILKRASGYR